MYAIDARVSASMGVCVLKSTGIVRKVDELGRIVIPIEIRRGLSIEERDPLEIYVDGDSIVLKKSGEDCVFCGSTENLTSFEGKYVCAGCIKKLGKA